MRTWKEAVSFFKYYTAQICRVLATERALHDTWLTPSHTKTLGAAGRSHCDFVSSNEGCRKCMTSKSVSMVGSNGWVSFLFLGRIKLWSANHPALLLCSLNIDFAIPYRLPIILKT